MDITMFAPLSISLDASPDAATRRAVRLLSMVLELHKAGYQHLRICPGYSLDGKNWLCYLLSAQEMYRDGWTPMSLEKAVCYRSGHQYFGWEDASADNARSLADKFVRRFPDTSRSAIGQDWPYAGWLAQVLGNAEHGILPAFFGGRAVCPPTVLPPPVSLPLSEEYVGTGCLNISHQELNPGDLPAPNADYEELWPFCLSFDGYRAALLAGFDCGVIAERTERAGLAKGSMEELRITAFYKQRAIKWSSEWPPEESLLRSIRAVVEEIRRRLAMHN